MQSSICQERFLRLDHHLIYHKKHENLDYKERENRVKAARRKCWQQGDMCSLAVSRKVDKVPHTEQNASDVKEREDTEETFVRRSVPIESASRNSRNRVIYRKEYAN